MSRKHLDISNNAHLRWGYCLQRFPAKSINMSKSGLTHFENIKSISLLELNASHTGISKFDALDLQNLRSLNISNTRIRDLTALSSSPIQELDISFCKVYGIHPLVSMRFLRLLRVHEGQFNKSQLSQLSKEVIVEFVD
jgi:Leucine-rich repeat (LRR) protein